MGYLTEYMCLMFFKAKSAKEIIKDESMEYCCTTIQASFWDGRVSIRYEPILREYWIMGKRNILIKYCPWCKYEFPKNLRDEWFDILEREYNIESPTDNETDLPEEFKTDEWWKKRGL
jgi:hypothetical protein